MSLSATTLLLRDFLQLQESSLSDVSKLILGIPTCDVHIWNAIMFGPDKTPYEDVIFEMTLVFGKDYPAKPPSVRFHKKIFHPNVKYDGSISRDVLAKAWSTKCDVMHVLSTVQTLLGKPNLDFPLNTKAAKLFRRNRRAYDKKVKRCIEFEADAHKFK